MAKGYINEETLIEQSSRYMLFYRDGPRGVNVGHPLLPLDILVAPPSGDKLVCKTCSRALSLGCFSKVARKVGGNGNCFVCHALKSRQTNRSSHQSGTQGTSQATGRSGMNYRRASGGRSFGASYIDCDGVLETVCNGDFGIFGYDDDTIPGGNYLRDMYDSD